MGGGILWKNTGTTFIELAMTNDTVFQTPSEGTIIQAQSCAWGDFNNDGNIDVALAVSALLLSGACCVWAGWGAWRDGKGVGGSPHSLGCRAQVGV